MHRRAITPSDRRLLLWSMLACFVSLHGLATVRYVWPRWLAVLPFSFGCLVYPALLYVTIRIATERRLSAALACAIVTSTAAFACYLLSLYLIIHP